jgi:hypothetical protein
MSLLKANLNALSRYPEAAAAVAAAPERALGEWTAARSGTPAVKRGGISLCSGFDPEAEARRAVPEWNGADFALLPGLGAGYLTEAVVERYPDLPVVVAEADAAWFREVLAHRDLTRLWDRAVPLVGPAESVGTFFSELACPHVETLPWRPLVQLEPEWNRAVADELSRAQTRAGVNAATYRRFGALWARNLARNETRRDVRPLSALRDRWKGCPAVIAAAGPSLADAMDWIAEHRRRVVLVAVDTAWPALHRRGLEPDVLVVLDGQYWNGRHLDEPLPERTLVVTEWTGPPRAFRLAPGRVYVAASSVSLIRRRETEVWGDLGALPTGGSVATAAWSLALHLGCREVAFAGLDLGYPRGQTHVPGSQFEETALRRADRLEPAETAGVRLLGGGLTVRPGVDGEVLSDARMDLFRSWLSRAAAARPDVTTVNLSRRGSFIAGLVSPEAGYGANWPELAPRPIDRSGALVSGESKLHPPWSALETLADEGRDVEVIEPAWAEARAYWGADWDSWAGREKTTWDRYPSARSRRGLADLAILTLSWRRFWEAE